MNLFFNFNPLDSWFKNNYPIQNKDLFIESKEKDFKKLLNETMKNNKIGEDDISSINIIVSLTAATIINPISIAKFSEFNKEWNIKFIETLQPLITFCRLNNKLFNIIFVYSNAGVQNIASIALAQILKTSIIGLNSETKSFKFKSKLFIIDKTKKSFLNKVSKLLLSKRKVIISNSKLLQQVKFNWIKKNLSYV